MQNQNTQTQNNQTETAVPGMAGQGDFVQKIAEKIRSSENILVALSRDPSVDEMAAAIGLTMFLDNMQKHATAIYSGVTPNALQFLQPEATFEKDTNSLQDFIIALNKEKADHLRYKLDGDFVKVYITPYKTTISEKDLEFSHGDFNVDLVLALGVPTAGDLDSALSEYGRIMHDASTVDITCEAPGRFGEIEWSEPGASSVSEMVTRLILQMQGAIDPTIATALLTGVVAATGRFSNERTNAETMQLASKLMEMGADQQLIAAHVSVDTMAMPAAPVPEPAPAVAEPVELGGLNVQHDDVPVVGAEVAAQPAVAATPVAQPLMDDLNREAQERAEARAALAAAATEAVNAAVTTATENAAAAGATGVGLTPEPVAPVAPAMPTVTVGEAPILNEEKDYGKMLEQALMEPLPVETAASAAGLLNNVPVEPAAPVVPEAPTMPVIPETPAMPAMPAPEPVAAMPVIEPIVQQPIEPVAVPVEPAPVMTPGVNPAFSAAPQEATGTLNAEPVLNTNAVVLPPAPAPNVGVGMMPPSMPSVAPAVESAPAPAMPNAFNIPATQ